jgi:hypothetical protein
MKLAFCSYSDLNYRENQQRQTKLVEDMGEFDHIFPYTREWLITTDFYRNHQDILDRERVAGYGLWKPFVVMETLKKLNDGDACLYMDCGDYPLSGISAWIKKEMKNKYATLISTQIHKNRAYTKRDTFVLMNADKEKYWDAIQIEAGVNVFKNTAKSFDLLAEWIKYCSDTRIVSDEPNVCGLPNLPEFVDTRQDQSVLSILSVRHNMNVNNDMREFVRTNVWHHKEGVEASNGMAKWDEKGNRIKE